MQQPKKLMHCNIRCTLALPFRYASGWGAADKARERVAACGRWRKKQAISTNSKDADEVVLLRWQ
jgi:hypothetical protein